MVSLQSFAVPSHGRQASLDSFTRASPVSQDKPFKNLTPAPSIPLSSSASHNSHRSSRQVSSRASRSPAGDHEVLASGQLSAAGDTTSRRLSSLQPSIQPGDRVEINEMDDGSFFWQHVRSKLRSDRPASEISNFTGFHSRSSSAESLTLPVTPSGSQPRAARPSILNKSHMEEPQGDMKLVWANKSHRRTRSKEGVGSLPYIRRHQDEGPAAQRRSQYSVSSDVEIFEADDEMMTHLIEDVSLNSSLTSSARVKAHAGMQLTSHMDQGAFNRQTHLLLNINHILTLLPCTSDSRRSSSRTRTATQPFTSGQHPRVASALSAAHLSSAIIFHSLICAVFNQLNCFRVYS